MLRGRDGSRAGIAASTAGSAQRSCAMEHVLIAGSKTQTETLEALLAAASAITPAVDC